MPRSTTPSSPDQQLRLLPILLGQLLIGMIAFAVVAVFLGPAGQGGGSGGGSGGGGPVGSGPWATVDIMGIALLATGVGCLAAFVAFGAVAKAQARRAWERREDDEAGRDAIARVLVTTSILRGALAEGRGRVAATSVYLQGGGGAGGGGGVSAVLILSLMASRSRLARLEEAATGLRGVGYRNERM